jgi:hypothetical protein
MKYFIFALLVLGTIVLSGCEDSSSCLTCRGNWINDIDRAIANIPASNSSADLSNYYNKTAYWINASNSFLKSYTETDPISIPKINNLNLTKLKITDWQTNISNYYTKSSYWANSTASFVKRNDWTTIDNYPTGCSAGQYVSAIGDTLTCSTPASGGSTCKTIYEDEFMTYGTTRTTGIGTCGAVLSGTAAATTDVYMGTIRFSDSTTINGGFRCYSGYTMYFIGGEKVSVRFKPNTNVLNTTIRIGFADSTTVAAPTDGCYLQCFNLVCTGYCKNNAGPTATASTYTLSANTWYTYTSEMNSAATSMNFSIYNAAKTTLLWSKAVTGNIPNTNARVFGTVLEAYQSTASAAAILVNWDYAKLEDCTWT